jgi:hypothetical protein
MQIKKNFSDGVYYFSMELIRDKFKSSIFLALQIVFPELIQIDEENVYMLLANKNILLILDEFLLYSIKCINTLVYKLFNTKVKIILIS